MDEFVNEFDSYPYADGDIASVDSTPNMSPVYYGGVVDENTVNTPIRYGADSGMPIRDFFRPYAIPLITVGGVGFLVWSVYKVYFEDVYYAPKDGKKAAGKKAWGTFLENVQGGMLGGMAFMLFIALLVSLKGWFNGEPFNAALGRLKSTLSGSMMLGDMQGQ